MKTIDPPKHKKDWVHKKLLLFQGWEPGHCLPPDGIPVLITRRMNASETLNSGLDLSGRGEPRILKVAWSCPHCGATHWGYLPVRWISEGKAVFVDKSA